MWQRIGYAFRASKAAVCNEDERNPVDTLARLGVARRGLARHRETPRNRPPYAGEAKCSC
jgi:hypothetical protein